MDSNIFKEWIRKNRNYDVTIEEYLNTAGTVLLYKDEKYMLTRTDTPKSTAYATTPTELCLAFPDDESVGFKNPIDEFLEHFFLYQIHLIEGCEKMFQTEDIGISVFKTKKNNKPAIRYWAPIQGPGEDLYYYDFNECIIRENLNKEYLNLPIKLLENYYADIGKKRGEL